MTDPIPSQPPLSAGAAPELPVVAWLDMYGNPFLVASTPPFPGDEPLALHAPAQATINEQAAEIERLKRERDKLRKDETSEPYAWFWQDGSETGVLTLRQDFESHAAKYPHMRFTPVWSTPRKSLKAKQVAEADECKRLADAMAKASAQLSRSRHSSDCLISQQSASQIFSGVTSECYAAIDKLASMIPAGGLAEEARDAARYRWLREQDWFSSPFCVLRDPKRTLTNGNVIGADCPSRDRLDAAIDAALSAPTPQQEQPR